MKVWRCNKGLCDWSLKEGYRKGNAGQSFASRSARHALAAVLATAAGVEPSAVALSIDGAAAALAEATFESIQQEGRKKDMKLTAASQDRAGVELLSPSFLPRSSFGPLFSFRFCFVVCLFGLSFFPDQFI